MRLVNADSPDDSGQLMTVLSSNSYEEFASKAAQLLDVNLLSLQFLTPLIRSAYLKVALQLFAKF